VVTLPASSTPDAVKSWIDWLPPRAQLYARLARLDRPAGTWLLLWPCIAGLALAGGLARAPWLILWFAIGSLVMRGAGCVWNDIVDRDLDAQVERTRARPVASGQVSVKAALVFAVLLSLIGLIVLLQLRPLAQAAGIARHPKISFQHASEVVTMDDEVMQAIRGKRDASMFRAIAAVGADRVVRGARTSGSVLIEDMTLAGT
jgi:hypothetical protein